MTDLVERDAAAVTPTTPPVKSRLRSEAFARRLRARHAAERRFRLAGAAAVALAALILVLLLGSIVAKGASAFLEARIRVEVTLDPAEVADRNYTALPMHHVGGPYGILWALLHGGSVVMAETFRTQDFWDIVRRYGITTRPPTG